MDDPRWLALFLAWVAAFVSTLGALFLGEVMGLQPCVLCWYQRIAMFPLVIVLGLGLVWGDFRSARYGLALAVPGGLVAVYHCLLYWGAVPKGMVPCGQGPSCTEGQLTVAGFIPIPLLSLVAFCIVAVLLFSAWKGTRQ
ncbi:disulfide bond formation protein B [Variovorax rhizosphaerae]|uniref:Disulfide bond formation protein B n=1 Tax=Variovorax rhizosphaerae TaxID=1836200 RepID=A0ABU8WZS0_9BURK